MCLIAFACKEEPQPHYEHWDYRTLGHGPGYYNWQLTRYDSTMYDIALDSLTRHSGSWGAHIFSVSDTPVNGGGVYYLLEVDLFQARTIRFSGWTRSENVMEATLWFSVAKNRDLPHQKNLGKEIFDGISEFAGLETLPDYFLSQHKDMISGTADWKKHEFTIDIPQEAAYTAFGIWMKGTGKLWLDDFAYEIIGKLPTDSSFKDRSMFISKPRDLDFEHTE